MSQRSVRPFSTISGVHPAYLPNLHKASRLEKRLVPAAVATVSIGYGIAKYKSQHMEQQHYAQSSQQAEAQRQAESDALMNSYGDRSSLAELEAAMKAYEERRGQR